MTNQMFSIGEVVEYCRPGSLNYGCEVIIAGPLKDWNSIESTGEKTPIMAHEIVPTGPVIGSHPPGVPFIAEPHHLRKKRPPREDLKVVSWDECPWQPESIHV